MPAPTEAIRVSVQRSPQSILRFRPACFTAQLGLPGICTMEQLAPCRVVCLRVHERVRSMFIFDLLSSRVTSASSSRLRRDGHSGKSLDGDNGMERFTSMPDDAPA